MDTIKPLFTATATATGGRNGHTETSDGMVAVDLSVPKAMGGPGKPNTATPEHLFAAGYAACFGNAVIHITRNRQHKIKDDDVDVAATVGLTPNGAGGFALTVALAVTLAGVDQPTAEAIVAEAHKTCPYSNATRGNIDVALTVRTR